MNCVSVNVDNIRGTCIKKDKKKETENLTQQKKKSAQLWRAVEGC